MAKSPHLSRNDFVKGVVGIVGMIMGVVVGLPAIGFKGRRLPEDRLKEYHQVPSCTDGKRNVVHRGGRRHSCRAYHKADGYRGVLYPGRESLLSELNPHDRPSGQGGRGGQGCGGKPSREGDGPKPGDPGCG